MVHRLLLADDSITIQKVVELVLAEEGFEIKAVNNGEEALAAISSFKPDIVLADTEMPIMNGYQLCEKIKTSSATQDVPVILLAGAFEPFDEELARQVGADDVVIKPFESLELISKINASLTAAAIREEVAAETEGGEIAAEAGGADKDLWTMEEIPAETAEAERWSVEEGVSLTAAFEAGESQGIEEGAIIEEEVVPPVVEGAVHVEERVESIPEVALPLKEELSNIFREAVESRVSVFLSTLDMKDVKDSVEKVLWEVAPELAEKLLREMLQGALASLTKEVEKVIWETVPDLAETMIAKEIEKIRSEI